MRFLVALACFVTSGLVHAEEVDVLAVSHDYASLPRNLIVVSPVPQPSKSGGKLEIAESLGRIMTEELIDALQRELPTAKAVSLDAAPAQLEGLVLEARFSKLVPGSRAKRFWLGFGAGKSVTEVSGEVRERATGRVVARFTHARLSWCCGFGSNDHEIRTNLVNTANDIAAVVANHFHAEQSYTWLDQEPASTAQAQPSVATGRAANLQIDASSEHAEVSVDGGFVGTTPLEIKLEAGSHRVVVKKRGFQDWTRDVQVIDGGKQALWADLQEAPPAHTQQGNDSSKK
jgi:uncharacterized protein DUF4410/PEGA domain-containing protein